MISFDSYIDIVNKKLERSVSPETDYEQYDAVKCAPNESIYIVAGPGSGKTTVMVLRVLKLIFVDDVDPAQILVTTFTRKAAKELRSRILGWGDQVREGALELHPDAEVQLRLKTLDFNQIVTGTLDSISESVLKEHREPGESAPAVIEPFITNALMVRYGLFDHGRFRNDDLKQYLKQFTDSSFAPSVSEMANILVEIKDRICHDRVDCEQYSEECQDPGAQIALEAIEAYEEALESRLLYDYARIERAFQEKMSEGTLDDFAGSLKFVLVDEYQDTNLLQEQIYFTLARYAQNNGGSITVVGDDDQSIYRFRGATVDLFTDLRNRLREQTGIEPRIIYLSRNYRSTQQIVNLVNSFIQLDDQFQPVRVDGKPAIQHARIKDHQNYPVIGIFRENVEALSHDVAEFIKGLLSPEGIQIDYQGDSYHLIADPAQGSANDICVLCHSPQEFAYNGQPRFPGGLRAYLDDPPDAVQVFNPRGQNVPDIPAIQILCGLMLECLDPERTVESTIRVSRDVRDNFTSWRAAALTYIESCDERRGDVSLAQYVEAWQNRRPLNTRTWSVREVPLMDIAYRLVSWIPQMQNDVEGLVYLEVIMRTINQSTLFTSFGAQIIFDDSRPQLQEKSIKDALQGIFVPLASGAIEINEDLLETLPRDRIPIMSIHQAKGLEYPVVVVDVGSDFRSNHWKQAKKRYPRDGGKTCRLEDELRPHSPLSAPDRSDRNRAFDDLTRLYFVAFSRPEDILILVGLTTVSDGIRKTDGEVTDIPNVATGWDRNNTWCWGRGLDHLHHVRLGGR